MIKKAFASFFTGIMLLVSFAWNAGAEPLVPPVSQPEISIIGDSSLDYNQMVDFAHSINPEFPCQLAEYYLEYGKKYGVRGDIAFAQMLLETGYYQYGGDVHLDQNNFAGIGTIGGGVVGNGFSTIEEGVKAHIQHLCAYAEDNPHIMQDDLVDPRFQLVTHGSATTWTALDGKWATNPQYGESILDLYHRMAANQPNQTSYY
jgi:hypothetical protein